uniref:CNH domain-containing protein n=1 Tax=Macrostomum lignano TaxID=282301 RepID=A0A1I8G1L2_9PLAT
MPSDDYRIQFFKELDYCSLLQMQPVTRELLSGCSGVNGKLSATGDDAYKQNKVEFTTRPTRSQHRFSRVRPLHVCAEHSFVCFRYNGDLVAATPNSVLVYDRPPAACELSYKELLYSIPISGVSMAADLSQSRILVLRQGSYMASDERAADELLMAEVATGDTQLMAKIALPQYSILRSKSDDHLLMRETACRRDGAECRGMQFNQTEHKVYLLYEHHLLVIDLDMQLEPLVIRLNCQSSYNFLPTTSENLGGPAVALMEFDHAVYVLTAGSLLLASNKTSLFSPSPSACCLPVLQRLDDRLAAGEIRSCVVDRRQATAFFSVPHGCKLISLAFPVPPSD